MSFDPEKVDRFVDPATGERCVSEENYDLLLKLYKAIKRPQIGTSVEDSEEFYRNRLV